VLLERTFGPVNALPNRRFSHSLQTPYLPHRKPNYTRHEHRFPRFSAEVLKRFLKHRDVADDAGSVGLG
jgi:hypothetical protein